MTFEVQIYAEDNKLFYKNGLLVRRDLPLAPSARAGFEMILLRMLAFYPGSDSQTKPDKKIAGVIVSAAKTQQLQPQQTETVQASPSKSEDIIPLPSQSTLSAQPLAVTNTEMLEQAPNWAELIPKLNLVGVATALAAHCVVTKWQAGFVELTLAPKHKPLLNDKLHGRLTQALHNYYGQPIKLEIKLAETAQLSPAQLQQQNQQERQQQARACLEQDEHVKTIISHFNAKLVSTDPI
jgi:DNA polymerase-3 subunit gamma/tau